MLDATRRYPTPVNDRIFAGKRSEPVKVYSSTLSEPNTQSMLPIGMFEAPSDVPAVFEMEAFLEKGAMVKLDCMRLPSPMVPAMPHTIQKIEPDGYPGVAFHWLEVEGPFIEEWPPASYRALFGDAPRMRAAMWWPFEQPLEGCGQAVSGVHGAGVPASGRGSGVRPILPVCQATAEGGGVYGGDDRDLFRGAGFA